ncbi:MAG: succinylglutamate desuccinylase/aspartoacylase family protein [Candidatus Rokubacteria bacterium]|nr:succinylglutamate desuccinylase/aspartoacylase family protein [Candidatus Rokubacteria bacterium]
MRTWDVTVSQRVGAEPWKIRFVEMKGQRPGPSTAFVAGVFGDKPLGCLALLELQQRLAGMTVRGTVIVVAAANPFALEAGTRISPDGLYLNRRFPGSPAGFLTDQIAYHLLAELRNLTDCIIDLHSGTPTMGLWYNYDYGDLDLTASFGYLPVVVGHPHEGQLSVAATRAGIRSCLPEFGGGGRRDANVGVAGCLNVLRFRGQVDGPATGPVRVPLIRELELFTPSTTGALCGRYGPEDVGKLVEAGVVGWVVDVATGRRLEEFVAERGGLLMLAQNTPAMVSPGAFAFMLGVPDGEVPVPNAETSTA